MIPNRPFRRSEDTRAFPGHPVSLRLPALLLCTLSAGSLPGPPRAAEDEPFGLGPGPIMMTVEERSIVPDVASGAQHGVILLLETLLDESSPLGFHLAHHLRAKILSNEGRDLANVVIPFSGKTKLVRWWGRVILPEGRVIDLDETHLKPQTILDVARWRVLKVALPGVVPGCVIDYGYIVRSEETVPLATIPLQRDWLIRHFRYRWQPASWLPNQYLLRRRPGLDVEARRQGEAVLIEGRNLPPLIREEWMPADHFLRAEARLFYRDPKASTDPEVFWNDIAKENEERLAAFLGKGKALRRALAEMAIIPGASLEQKLRTAYDWLEDNLENRSLGSWEQEEASEEEAARNSDLADGTPQTAGDVLSRREGSSTQMRMLFIGLVRALGAEANLVLAPDRRTHMWIESLLASGQLQSGIVAVRRKGEPDEKATLVSPGWGLPYGVVPWWMTATESLLVDASGARKIWIPPPDGQRNLMETGGTIAFTENGTARVDWWAMGTGLRGYEERVDLRATIPAERRERLRTLCGAAGDFEVIQADAPSLGDLNAGFRTECKGDLVNLLVDDSEEEFLLGIEGAWIPPVPRFVSRTRIHPVVFSFPFVDHTTLEVGAPPGFVPRAAPSEVRLETPFGSYELRVTAVENGYRVERSFAILALSVQPDRYDELRGFIDRVRVADRTMLEFKRLGATR